MKVKGKYELKFLSVKLLDGLDVFAFSGSAFKLVRENKSI
jgi:hypothetical protein